MLTFSQKLELRRQLETLVEITYYIPALNEEQSIVATLDKLVEVSNNLKMTFELLVYNDGSTDETRELVEEFARKNPQYLVTLVNNRVRRGIGFNYVDGAFRGVGKYYTMICGDDAETKDSLYKLLGMRGKADIIIPYFDRLDDRNLFRRKLSKTFTGIVNLLSGHKLHYYNGPCIHIRTNVARWNPTGSGFAYQAELLCLLLSMHKSYIEINIDNNDRETGVSRAFHIKNFLSVGHSLVQILLRRWRNSIWPMDVN